jgi:hypothetical protein
MATTHSTPTVDEVFTQVKEASEQVLAEALKASNICLDLNEQIVDRAIDYEIKLAGMTQQAWLKGLIEAQADFAREVTGSYTKVVRGLLK